MRGKAGLIKNHLLQSKWFLLKDVRLEVHVHDGGGQAVAGVNVGLGDGEVVVDHGEGGVAEDHFEGVGVATVAQVVDGEGVTEAVGVDVGDFGAAAYAVQLFEETVTIHGFASRVDEEAVGEVALAFEHVAPENLAGAG